MIILPRQARDKQRKSEGKWSFRAGPDGFRQAQIHFTDIENDGWQHYFNMPGNMRMDNPHYVRRRDRLCCARAS